MQVGTYSDGRPLNYDETSTSFDVGGTPVTPADVVGYDQAGQVDWLSDDLKSWARTLASGQAAAAQTPDTTSSPAAAAQTRKGLFGFRSRQPWKMVVASLYYLFAVVIAIGSLISRKPYATNGTDIALEVLSGLLLSLVLLSPAFLLSDFGYRDRLPLFKRRKAVWSALGLALFLVLMLGTSAFAATLHTQPYKVAAAAEIAAQEKAAAAQRAAEEAKRAAEASATAAAEAKTVAEEASATAEASRLADEKKAAEASATAEAQRLADAKKAAEASAAVAAQKPVPTPTPTTPPKTETKADYLRRVVTAVLGAESNTGDNKPKIRNIEDSGGDAYWLVTLNGDENLTNDMTKKGMWLETKDVWKRVFTERKDIDELIIRWYYPLVDAKGNTADERVMELVMTKKNAADVKWDNLLLENVPVIADDYWESPVFKN